MYLVKLGYDFIFINFKENKFNLDIVINILINSFIKFFEWLNFIKNV